MFFTAPKPGPMSSSWWSWIEFNRKSESKWSHCKNKQFQQYVTCLDRPSTQTQEWGTAAPLALPSCLPVRRVRKSWGCWRKPSTGNSSLPWGDPSPRASIMSSPGMIFTTRPGWMVDHRGTHRIGSFSLRWVHYYTECEHLIWTSNQLHMMTLDSCVRVIINSFGGK